VKFTEYTDESAFDTLERSWNELVQRSVSNTPFQTWEWNSAWWAAYQPGDLWVVTCEDNAGHLLGIAPWFLDDERVLRFIGHIDVTDFMDLIVDADQQATAYTAYAQFLADHKDKFERIGLANILSTSPTYTDFPDALREQGFDVSFEQNDVAPRIDLPTDYSTYLSEILDSKQRKEVKRKMRKAEGGLYAVEWEVANETNADVEAVAERFLKLMQSADADKAAFLQNEQHVDFFKRITAKAQAAGWLEVLVLHIDGNDCAAYYNFDYNDHIYVYNSGLDPSTYGALGPGIILLQYAIQHAIDNEKRVFDFLRGDETYKYQMGGEDEHIYQLNATVEGS